MTTKKGVVVVAFNSRGVAYQVDDPVENPDPSWIKAGWVKVTAATKRKPRRKKKVSTDG